MIAKQPASMHLLDAVTILLSAQPDVSRPHLEWGEDAMAFGPTEPWIGGQAIRAGLDGTDLRDTPPFRLGRLEGSRSAWFWAAAPATSSSGWRTSGLLTANDDSNWSLDHLHLSHPLPNATISDYARSCQTLPAVGESVPSAAAELVDLMQNNLASTKLTLLADRSDTVVIGTDAAELWEGHDAFLASFLPMLDQIRALEPISRFSYPGGIRARLTNDGMCGYVASNIVGTFGEESLPPFRFSWIFAKIDATFRLVSDHHSAAFT